MFGRSCTRILFVLNGALLLLACMHLNGQEAATTSIPVSSVVLPSVARNYGELPLRFEVNQGQADPKVRFLSRGDGYSLFLTDSEAVLVPQQSMRSQIAASPKPAQVKPFQWSTPNAQDDVVRMQLGGASSLLKVTGMEKLPGTVNYFIGNDPGRWHSSVPTFGKVKYEEVYPGVDLVYYGNQHRLEYDFIVKPGADARSIRLHFTGAKRMVLAKNGDLALITKHGQIAFHKPLIYQDINGERRPVDGGFVQEGRSEIGIRIKHYEPSANLIIDPQLVYSTYLGGKGGAGCGTYGLCGGDSASGIAVDSTGNAYITGRADSIDFPVTADVFQGASAGTEISFITKLNSSGSAEIYSTYLGGTNGGAGDVATSIALDAAGEVFLTGAASSSNFPISTNAFQQALKAGSDYTNAFVTKLNATGSSLIYSTFLGGSGNAGGGDVGNAIAVDPSGNAYITGLTYSEDFPITGDAYQTTNNDANIGFSSAFITKINPTGSALVYSTYLGGSGNNDSGDVGAGIAIDSSGNAYVTGLAVSTDFPTTPNAFQTSCANSPFVTKLNATGSGLVYSTCAGNGGGTGIAISEAGNAYFVGSVISMFPVTPNAFQTAGGSAFVAELNSAGTNLIYGTYLSGTGNVAGAGDSATGISIDSSGNAYITGNAYSPDFPVTANAFQNTNNAIAAQASNAFISELNQTGSVLIYSSYLGGSNGDGGTSIGLDGSANAYVAGYANSSNFPVTANAFQKANNAAINNTSNAFIAKIATSSGGTTGPVANISVFSGSGQTAAYGTSFPSPLVVLVSDANGNPVSGATVNFAGAGLNFSSTTATTGSNGEASVTASPTKAGNLTAIASTSGVSATASFSMTAAAAVLTVTATNQSIAYDKPISPLTYTLTGFMNGDTATVLSGSPTETTTAQLGSLPGTYPIVITQGTLMAENYTFAFVNGVLAVMPLQASARPSFSPAPGTYSSVEEVSLSEATAGSTIYFTTNGTPPTTSSTKYTTPITVSSSETIQAIAIASGFQQSAIASASYTIQTASPSFSPAPGTYTSDVTVTISDPAPSAVIHFTTDGSTPTKASPLYTGPLTVTASETITAIATIQGIPQSLPVTGTFTIIAPPILTPYGSEFPGGYYSPSIQVSEDITNGCQGKVGLPAISTFNDGYTSPMYGITNLQTYINGNVQENFFPLNRVSPGVWIPSQQTYMGAPSLIGSGFIFPAAFGSNATSTYKLALSSTGLLTISETGSGTDVNTYLPDFTSALNGKAAWSGKEITDLNTGNDEWQFTATFNGSFPARLADGDQITCPLTAKLTASANTNFTILLSNVINAPPTFAVTTKTVAHVPGISDNRTRVGVGEYVVLSSNIPSDWTISSGGGTLGELATDANGNQECTKTKLSGLSKTACFTAPYSSQDTVVTAKLPGRTVSVPFTIVEPSGVVYKRLLAPGYAYGDPKFVGEIGMWAAFFVVPGTVSFSNVGIAEEDVTVDERFTSAPKPLLFYIPTSSTSGINAWLVGCDKNVRPLDPAGFVDPFNVVYTWGVSSSLTPHEQYLQSEKRQFATAQQQVLLKVYKWSFRKGQIRLSMPLNVFVEPTADLDVKLFSPPSTMPETISGMCITDVKKQFDLVSH